MASEIICREIITSSPTPSRTSTISYHSTCSTMDELALDIVEQVIDGAKKIVLEGSTEEAKEPSKNFFWLSVLSAVVLLHTMTGGPTIG